MFKERTYRSWTAKGDLVPFGVVEGETDLAIYAAKRLEGPARAAVLTYRQDLERYIRKHPEFGTSLEPLNAGADAPMIVRAMADAAARALVGPMAAVAGAVAEFVGRDLLQFSGEMIVENGGDIFIRSAKKRILGIYAGDKSPFTGQLAIEIGPREEGVGVCTSSGTVSHSLSFGKSDAVVIISEDTALADAVATATGNILKTPDDIEKAIGFAKSVDGVSGVLVMIGDTMGSWGDIRLV